MRKVLIIAACFLLLTACNSNNKSENNSKKIGKQQNVSDTRGCKAITTNEFRAKVADINKAEWRFLGNKPAIVDFYADWCGPCRMIAPTIEKVAQKYSNEIDVYKVNIDNEPELARAFDISSIPTILFIPMSGEPVQEVGIITMAGFERNIKNCFGIGE